MKKPKHCNEKWLDMTPTEHGRLCGSCQKHIVDFTKMSWSEIEKTQAENNNSLCGMYSKKQLNNWGREVPSKSELSLKAAIVTGLCLSISGLAQSQDSLRIKGRVIDQETREALPYANVVLKQTKVGVNTDLNGEFELEFPNRVQVDPRDTLEVSSLGYSTSIVILENLKEYAHGTTTDLNVELNLNSATVYAVTVPSPMEKATWKIKNLFRKK